MDREAFFASVRRALFNGRLSQSQVGGINGILAAWEDHGTEDSRHLAYVLATAYHETGQRMVPVREGFALTDQRAREIVARRNYGRPAGPYGHVYYGRGHVQLTWHENYVASSEDAGVDLEKNPDAMLDPEISARVMINGILDGRWNAKGKGLEHYIHGAEADYRNARRTVNITDRWWMIRDYALAFGKALAAAHSATETSETPLLRQGDSGEAVARLQGLLADYGMHLKADGDFGPKTHIAVKLFQQDNGLRVDGKVGQNTWRALLGP